MAKLTEKQQKAATLFEDGYNCAQAVFGAFCEELGMSFEEGIKLASSFGGGMGRLREVCGAVSAMFMIAGIKKGYTEPNNDEVKALHYKLIQDLAQKFKDINGTIICRELLDEQANGYVPSKRTEEYYQTRPCEKFVIDSAGIIEKYIL